MGIPSRFSCQVFAIIRWSKAFLVALEKRKRGVYGGWFPTNSLAMKPLIQQYQADLRQALLDHKRLGMAAQFSGRGSEWEKEIREAVEKLSDESQMECLTGPIRLVNS